MNEEQYSRANKRVLLAIVVVFGYIVATLMLALGVSQGGHAAKIVMAAVIVISVVAYLGKRTTRTCAVIMTLSMMIGYFVIVQLNTTVGTWTYGLPLLIVAMVYLDKKIVMMTNGIALATTMRTALAVVCGVPGGRMVTNGIALVSIVVHLVRCFLGDGSDLQNNVIGLFVLLLIAYACNSAERLLERFFKENLAEIQNASDIQKDSNKKMIIVAENISKHFGEAMDMLDGLQESINVSHSSIQEIADSTESTAEAIQKQAVMCSDIQGNTDQAEQGIKEMIEASHKTNDNVKEGAGVVSELKEQAVNVADASQVTVDVIRSLTDKVEEVKTFVDSIINISNQTNLLALNASIEAARAGEAGKGFAVVADEIRQLSEQTKDASANITEIIQKLNEDTKRANDSIMTAAESVEKQNQLIDDTRDKFNDVGNAVEVLMGNIDVAEQSIQKILDATGVISDNITHLSATGEEVAASSTEGLRTADITVEKMSNCRKVLENIYLLAEDLKNSVENNENQ